MMTEVDTPRKAKTRKPKKKNPARPRLEPGRFYSRTEAAAIFDQHPHTFMRAYHRGHLEGFRSGRNVFHSAEQLMRWLESGGRTG